jgi:hypothetical protein
VTWPFVTAAKAVTVAAATAVWQFGPINRADIEAEAATPPGDGDTSLPCGQL